MFTVRQRLALASKPELLPAYLRCLHVVHARRRLRNPVLVSIDSLTGPTVLDARLSALWAMPTKLQSREGSVLMIRTTFECLLYVKLALASEPDLFPAQHRCPHAGQQLRVGAQKHALCVRQLCCTDSECGWLSINPGNGYGASAERVIMTRRDRSRRCNGLRPYRRLHRCCARDDLRGH